MPPTVTHDDYPPAEAVDPQAARELALVATGLELARDLIHRHLNRHPQRCRCPFCRAAWVRGAVSPARHLLAVDWAIEMAAHALAAAGAEADHPGDTLGAGFAAVGGLVDRYWPTVPPDDSPGGPFEQPGPDAVVG